MLKYDNNLELAKDINEIQKIIDKYDRSKAINIIRRIRFKYPYKNQSEKGIIVFYNIPLEKAKKKDLINALKIEKFRLELQKNNEK